MKITISGAPGSGKSTVAKRVAEKLELRHFSSGDYQRTLAKEMGLTITELARVAETDPEIDKKTDSWAEAIGEADDNFVMDSRLAFDFIPDSIKIFLDVTEDEAARRVFHEKRKEETENTTQGRTFEVLKERKDAEMKRYQKYYGIDYTNPDNYDLVIDTTSMPIHKVIEEIIKLVKEKNP